MKQSLAVIPVKGTRAEVRGVDRSSRRGRESGARAGVGGFRRCVYEGDLKRSPLFLDIPATPGKTHMVLETSIDRLFRPSDSGSRDRRELGLSIRDWVWE